MTKTLVRLLSLLGMATVAALALTIELPAQDNLHHRHRQYKLVQVGTFGGPDRRFMEDPFGSALNYFNSQGATVGMAATNKADPFNPNCWYDCFVTRAFKFENGR